jgi:hypothetical protein
MVVVFAVAYVVANYAWLSQDNVQWTLSLFGGLMLGASFSSYDRVQKERVLSLATVYLITDRRIIYAAEWPSGAEFRWVWLNQLPAPRVRVGEQGVGTISFSSSGVWARVRGVSFTAPLRAVPDATRVADLIVQIQDRSRPTPTGPADSTLPLRT